MMIQLVGLLLRELGGKWKNVISLYYLNIGGGEGGGSGVKEGRIEGRKGSREAYGSAPFRAVGSH